MANRRLTEAKTDPATGLTCGILTKYGKDVVALAKTAMAELAILNQDDPRLADAGNPSWIASEARDLLGCALRFDKKPPAPEAKTPGSEACGQDHIE